MKNELFHTVFPLLNYLTTFFLLLPVAILIFKRNTHNWNLFPLGILFLMYCTISLVNNAQIPATKTGIETLVLFCFFFMAPLTILSLQFFTQPATLKPISVKAIWISLSVYLISGLSIFITQGLTETTGSAVIGIGLILVLIFALPIFFNQIRETIQKRKETGKAFIITAIVFAFCCYLLIFLLNAFFFNFMRRSDGFLLFHLTTILYAAMLSIGLLIYKPTVCQAPEIKPVKPIPMLTEWEEYEPKT